jgi:hypothetical protein
MVGHGNVERLFLDSTPSKEEFMESVQQHALNAHWKQQLLP